MSAQAKGKAPIRSKNFPSSMLGVSTLEIDVTEGLRTMVIDSDEDDDQDVDTMQQRLRQHSDAIPATTNRPPLARKAATAPPGELYIYKHPRPHIPRRAISERANRGTSNLTSRQRSSSDTIPPIPRRLQSTTVPPRSAITRKMTNRKTVGRVGSKTNRHVWRLSPRASAHLRSISEAMGERKKLVDISSFSEKARVKETLERKKMDPLRTTPFVDFKLKDLPGTPSSMVATPRELYGEQSSNGSARASPKGPRLLRDESPLLPAHSAARTTPRAKHFSLPLTPQIQRRATLKRSSSETKTSSSPEKRTVYIPGPIRIEDRMVATPRKGSIATLDLFAQPYTQAKRFSDLVALDSIVCFFQELGIVEEASEEGLDLYWLPGGDVGEGISKTAKGGHSDRTGQTFTSASPSPRVSIPDGQRHAASPEIPGRRRLRSLLHGGSIR
ncbi:unnamed protein product [Periconia digitata]|uniref:Uncharacterized protein n=1 Tax=Periconia digitata TaxID=1303443 RepID=A0A9W4U2Y8_9PLEO|nr:unnamed protein product [Periconia digitata]